MLRLNRENLIGFGVQVCLQFVDFREIDLVIVDVYFSHNFSIVVADLCKNLN